MILFSSIKIQVKLHRSTCDGISHLFQIFFPNNRIIEKISSRLINISLYMNYIIIHNKYNNKFKWMKWMLPPTLAIKGNEVKKYNIYVWQQVRKVLQVTYIDSIKCVDICDITHWFMDLSFVEFDILANEVVILHSVESPPAGHWREFLIIALASLFGCSFYS